MARAPAAVRLAALLVLVAPAFASARRVPPCKDPLLIAAARAAIDPECDCASATNHSAYVRCVSHVGHRLARDGVIPEGCVSAAKKCASHSTCGRAGFVACCRTNADGETTCSVKEGAKSCHSQGTRGSACVSRHVSCCDACTATSCASPSGAFIDDAGGRL